MGGNEPASKRRKQENDKYISIRKVWGPPGKTFPVKKASPESTVTLPCPKKSRVETLVNCKVVEPKVLEGEEIDFEKLEKLDWDKEMKKYKEMLEEKEMKKNELLRKQSQKLQVW